MNFATLNFVVYRTIIEGDDGVEVYLSSELLSLVSGFKCCACHVETRLDCGGRQREIFNTSQTSSRDNPDFADFGLFNNNGCFFFQ